MACTTSSMYTLNPIFKLDDLKINSPMYTMKNIHGETSCNKESSSDDSIIDQVAAKQDVIFKLIGDIKDLLAVLKKELSDPKIASRSSVSSTMLLPKPEFSNLGIIHEIVLNTSVKNPPNSLLVLNLLWENVDFLFSWHTHSSVKGLPKTLKKFESIKNQTHDGNPQIRIRVVWKEVWSDCELVVSPLNSVPLLGEVNFLRFLNRSFFPEISDHYTMTLFDAKLDACHSLGYYENIQQLQEYYNILSEGLDKTKWLVGNNLTIVDLACWSAVSNLKNPNLNVVLTRWFKDFESLVNKKK